MGLLDANDPLLMLGAGLLSGGTFGQALQNGLLGMQQAQAGAEDRSMRRELYGAQIEQKRADAAKDRAALEAQQRRDAYMLGGTGSATAEGGVAQPGLLKQLSDKFGVPPEQLMADYQFNGGKKIAEMLNDRSKPSYQNVGGNLVNTNAPGFAGGIQDQVTMGPDGRATVLRSNNGSPVMGAVPGSFDTYSAFKDIDNRTNAAYTPGRPVLDAEGRQRGQSQLQEIRGPAAPMGNIGRLGPTNAAERGMAAQVADLPAVNVQREIAQLRNDLPSLQGRERQAAEAYLSQLEGEFGRAPAATAGQSPAGALDFSPAEKAAQDAARERAVGIARADAGRDTADRTKVRQAGEGVSDVDRALELLSQGPTGSGMGEFSDKLNAFFGTTTPSAKLAAQLDVVAANLVKNVPRFEGPQSDKDVDQYKAAAGRVADRGLPAEQRMAAAEEVRRLQERSASAAGGGAAPESPRQPAMSSLPTANPGNKGKKIRDTQTGKILVSNGMQWKEQ